jgi:8-oxo-dGTP pyrophosphatase MutT (NUDIX family)
MNLDKWSVAASRYVLQDRWISVRADDCVTTEGVTIAPYYVLEYPDWVQIVALDDRGNVLLIKQYRHALGDISTEIPAGGVDSADADPIAAAHRELLEETGYTAGRARILSITSPNAGTHANCIHTVLMQDIRYHGQVQDDPSERIEPLWVSCEAAFQMAISGRIANAMQGASLVAALAAVGLVGFKGK